MIKWQSGCKKVSNCMINHFIEIDLVTLAMFND